MLVRPRESNLQPPTLQSSTLPTELHVIQLLSRSTCTVLKGWLCITCEEMLAILLGGHFQIRELYLGGRGSSDKKTSISHLCSNFSRLTESLSHYSINWHILKINYLKKLEPMREKKSLVNDRLSPASLILVRKVTGNEFVFLCDPVFMLDKTFWNIYRTLWNVFRHSLFYYRTPTKNPSTLRIKMSCL